MKSANTAVKSTRNIFSLPTRKERREKHELAFLPAALEIVESPPSPIGRAIGATIVAFFCLALIWATFGHVDVVASASGKVIPSGRVKLIQPFEAGVVRAIHVRDGQNVKRGDALIELDPTMSASEEDHIRSDLLAAQLDIARLRAALSGAENPDAAFQPPAAASSNLIAMQRKFLAEETEEYRAKLATLDRQGAQKMAERDTVDATIDKLEASEPIIAERVDILKTLSDKGLGSKLIYLESLQHLTENEKELAVQRSRRDEAEAAFGAIIETRAQEAAEFQHKQYGELAEAERKAAVLSDDLVKAEQRTKLQILTAPVDGVVQQLSVHTIGGVVRAAQELAVIVPSDAVLEIEAMVSNRDVGFVRAGQTAQIKVDAFPFTRYGLLHGRVVTVSEDAIARDVTSDKGKDAQSSSESTSSEPKGLELSYAAHISLDRAGFEVNDTFAPVTPGMAVTVEVKTGSRRLISYLLSPVLKYKQEALRER